MDNGMRKSGFRLCIGEDRASALIGLDELSAQCIVNF